MQDGRRHLHELEPGEAGRLPLTGRVLVVEKQAPGRTLVRDPSPGELVEGETWDGQAFSFRRPGGDVEPVSGTAEVLPLPEPPAGG